MSDPAIIEFEDDEDERPRMHLPRRQLTLVTASLLLSQMLSAFDTSIISTAMPSIVADLAGLDLYAWVTTANLVTTTSVIPIAGKLGDLFGRKRFIQGGIVGFILASMLAGASQSMTQLLVARAIQGVFGGLLMASSIASIADLYLPAARARMHGVFMSVYAFAAISGPILGGILTDTFSWRAVFYFNVPLAIVASVAVALLLPKTKANGTRAHIDVVGALLLAAWVVPLLTALTVMRDGLSPLALGLLGGAVVLLAAFLLVERQTAHPVIPLRIFRDPTITISVLVSGLASFGMMGSNIYIPLVYQGLLHLSATASGLYLAPRIVGMVVASLISGQLVSRIDGYRFIGVAGFALLSAGLFLMSRVTVGSTELDVMRALLLIGIGFGLTQPIYQNVVMSAVPHGYVGVSSSQVQFSRALGQTVGVTALGAVLAAQIGSTVSNAGKLGSELTPTVLAGLQAGLADAFLLAAGGCAIATLVALRLKEVRIRGRGRRAVPLPAIASEAHAIAD